MNENEMTLNYASYRLRSFAISVNRAVGTSEMDGQVCEGNR